MLCFQVNISKINGELSKNLKRTKKYQSKDHKIYIWLRRCNEFMIVKEYNAGLLLRDRAFESR